MKNRGGNFFHLAMILFLLTGFFVLPKIAFGEGKITINEIMYNCDDNVDWIELKSNKAIILQYYGNEEKSGWKIENLKINDGDDGTNHRIYMKKQEPVAIKENEYFIITTDVEKFKEKYTYADVVVLKSSINLTKPKKGKKISIFLEDNNEDEIVYDGSLGAKENKTIEKDEDGIWKESNIPYGTPGRKNFTEDDEFKEEEIVKEAPKFSIKKDDKIYKNIYANFVVELEDKNQKVTWNFGDGHKSYLQKTRHKYAETGTYQANLTLRGENKLVENFVVEVGKFGESKIKIVSVKANPKGRDDKETITLKNNSKKKINLENWSIATGWKKLSNHPIKKKLVLKSGEEKEITKKYSAFTLNNKQTKIELRYPDGTVVSKIKYSKKEGIEDDEIYEKGKKGWQWVETQAGVDSVQSKTKAGADLMQTEAESNDNAGINIEKDDNQDSGEKADDEIREDDEKNPNQEILGAETFKDVENKLDNRESNKNFFQRLIYKANWSINNIISAFFLKLR